MAFRASSGRIRVTDAADLVTVFDTQEGLFQATDFKTGSITIPQRSATYNGNTFVATPVNNNNDHALHSVNAAADAVIGGFKVTTSTPAGLVGFGWFNAGGTYIHYLAADPFITGVSTQNRVLTSMASYTFKCVGGSLVVNERVMLHAQPTLSPVIVTLTLLAVTFDYKLYCGSFV